MSTLLDLGQNALDLATLAVLYFAISSTLSFPPSIK
jgi:hypothetical protein